MWVKSSIKNSTLILLRIIFFVSKVMVILDTVKADIAIKYL